MVARRADNAKCRVGRTCSERLDRCQASTRGALGSHPRPANNLGIGVETEVPSRRTGLDRIKQTWIVRPEQYFAGDQGCWPLHDGIAPSARTHGGQNGGCPFWPLGVATTNVVTVTFGVAEQQQAH